MLLFLAVDMKPRKLGGRDIGKRVDMEAQMSGESEYV